MASQCRAVAHTYHSTQSTPVPAATTCHQASVAGMVCSAADLAAIADYHATLSSQPCSALSRGALIAAMQVVTVIDDWSRVLT